MSNVDPRKTRDMESRDNFVRPETWEPPSLLPTPEPKDGIVYRWVRVAMLGEDDAPNVSKMRREGWEPVQASEQPAIASSGNTRGQFRDGIEVGGLVLCKNTTAMMNQRREYYENMTRSAQQSVDNSLMKENDHRMPLFKDSKTKVTFGSGGG